MFEQVSSIDFGLRPAQLSLAQVVDLVKVFEKCIQRVKTIALFGTVWVYKPAWHIEK